MSSGNECSLIEVKPGEWWYLLEAGERLNDYDWYTNSYCHGPFPSEDAAYDHLRGNYVNPGGYGTQVYDPAYPLRPLVAARIEKAKNQPKVYGSLRGF